MFLTPSEVLFRWQDALRADNTDGDALDALVGGGAAGHIVYFL